jgi:rhodanese-related sulfurtransferase
MIQQTKTGSAPGVSGNRPAFLGRPVIKDCLYFLALAILLGGLLNYSLLAGAFNGSLIASIQQKQLVDLKSKSALIYPGISFVELESAKKLYDDKLAVFLDARSSLEYDVGHISGAIHMPAKDLLKGIIDPAVLLPDQQAVLIAYCDGGECELGLDIARELSGRGYLNIFVLGEGYPGWETAGYPTEK